MSAPALNVAPVTPPSPGAVAKPAGGKPGAFESKLAETATVPDAETPTATSSSAAQPLHPELAARLKLEGPTDGQLPPEGEGQPEGGEVIILVPPGEADASLALAAAAAAANAAATATETVTPVVGEGASPPAFGRDKAKGSPAAAALAHANAHARLAEKAADAAAPADEALLSTSPDQGDAKLNVPTPQASAQGIAHAAPRSAAAQAAAAPVEAPPPAVDAAVEPTTQPVDAAATETAATASAAALAGRPAPAATSRPAEPARAERGKPAIEDAAPAKAAGAARRTSDAKPAAAAENAPAAGAAAGEASAAAGREFLDDPDTVAGHAEATASTAGSASAAPALHAVRGSPETVANLAAQIIKKLDARETRFDLELDPHGLGKVDVRILIGAQGQLTAAMVCDNPQAAAELKARAAELQRQLEQAGFNVSGGITFDVAHDRGHGRQGWADAQDQSGQGNRGKAFQAALDTAGQAELAASGPLRMRRGVTAGLDVRI